MIALQGRPVKPCVRFSGWRLLLPERLRFHDLRHTAGSLMLAAGAEIADVSKILRHSSIVVTMKVYAHSYKDNRRKAVASVARQLRKAGATDDKGA